MTVRKAVSCLAAGSAVLLMAGCSAKASFTKSELDAIKNHTAQPMPAGAGAVLAAQAKRGGDLYKQRLKEHGMLDANGQLNAYGTPANPGKAETPKK
jgi:hypothetical protein